MADLDISANIFSEIGSRYFKNKIVEKKIEIPSYSNAKLLQEKEHLEFKKHLMNNMLESDGFSPAQKITYEIYLKDVEDLINDIDARLLEGGARKKSRSRRKSIKRKCRKSRKGRKGRKSIKRKCR